MRTLNKEMADLKNTDIWITVGLQLPNAYCKKQDRNFSTS